MALGAGTTTVPLVIILGFIIAQLSTVCVGVVGCPFLSPPAAVSIPSSPMDA